MIKVENLSRNYGKFRAVDDVSFSISRGEIVGLLGHNGAGKTTIMKMLTAFLEPTEGKVLIDDLDISEKRLEVQKKIGYLPENCPLYHEMTVFEYLEYIAYLRGFTNDTAEKQLGEVISRTGLADRAKQRIGTLSRGYQQRVGVAGAILHNPEILILDEPTNGLDPSQIQGMRSLIKELSEKSTVIISTHILQEVQAICDRVLIILNGKLALDSRLEDLQSSNRLLLSIDKQPEEAKSTLGSLSSVKAIEHMGSTEHGYDYLVELAQNGSDISAELARSIIEKGIKLYSFAPEKRDLESVFREINVGGSNAE